jgi:hypothetical protein
VISRAGRRCEKITPVLQKIQQLLRAIALDIRTEDLQKTLLIGHLSHPFISFFFTILTCP